MSEFEQYVREQLRGLHLDHNEREEVIAEIATHLELVFEEYRSGLGDAETALQQALSEFGDSKCLVEGIRRAKEKGMNERFYRLWIPALSVGFIAYASQQFVARLIARPQTVEVFGNYYVYSWAWLFLVFCLAGSGAWWSRNMGGSRRERLLVALAPAEIMALVIAIVFPVGCVIEAAVNHSVPYMITHPLIMLAGIAWMLHCAVPALLGALPFLFDRNSNGNPLAS